MYKKICILDDSPGDPDDYDHKKNLVYILKPDEKVPIAEGVFECTYGKTLVQQTTDLLPEKVLMLVGATGKGKSTLINRLINHIFGVKSSDDFRFQLVVERELSQTESQTKDITKYVIYKSELLFKLIIIDTPGFGDTAGKMEDEIKLRKIKNLFTSNTIVSIDAICFVANYNDQRLTEYHSYVFYKVATIFGEDVDENFFVMATFCDSTYDADFNIKPAPTLNAIKKADIPFKNSFPFNNKDIFTKPVGQTDRNHWLTSMISFRLFFDELDKTMPVSLNLSRDILEKQHTILHAQLPDFVRKLKNSVHMIDEHKENLKAIERAIENPDQNFTYTVTVEKEVMEDIDEPDIYCTRCKNCDRVCHYPCTINNDSKLWWCDIVSWFNLQFRMYCTVCENKCSWKDHECCKKKPVRRTVEENRTDHYLKLTYLIKKGDKKVNIMKSCEDKMVSAYGGLLKDLESIQECIDFINIKCLSKNSTTLEKYMYDIIAQERKDKEDGYVKRITVLENLIASMKKINIFKAFKKASDEDKVQQAKQCFKEITIN